MNNLNKYDIQNFHLNQTSLNINDNYLTLGNIEISHREKSNDSGKRKNNLEKKKSTKILVNKQNNIESWYIQDDENTKLVENNKNPNRKISFIFNDSVKKTNMSKIHKYNSYITNVGINEYTDYRNFFYLTFESIKYSTEKVHIFREIDVEKLYIYSIIHSIPFYKVIRIL